MTDDKPPPGSGRRPPESDARAPAPPTVEVSPDLEQPVPTADPPSGDMRPLDMAAQEIAPPAYEVPGPAYDMTGPTHPAGPYDAPSAIPHDAPTQPTGSIASDDQILPPAYDERALRDAVGAPPPQPKRKRERLDDDGLPKPARSRTFAIAAIAIVLGLVIATFVLLGHANSQRYVVACATDHVTAEQGRGFPPWGTKPLIGPEWKAIGLPPNAECTPRETDNVGELEKWYLDLLLDRASTTLTSRTLLDPVPTGKANPLDLAAEQLNQALLLSRSPERRDQRKEVERLLGDVQYWRASLRLRDAASALGEAAKQFDAAAAQRPRHVTDAAEWAAFLRRLVDELHAGPSGVASVLAPSQPPSEHPSAPLGTAMPVEPDGSASEPAAPPPDAGLPTGGVLL